MISVTPTRCCCEADFRSLLQPVVDVTLPEPMLCDEKAKALLIQAVKKVVVAISEGEPGAKL